MHAQSFLTICVYSQEMREEIIFQVNSSFSRSVYFFSRSPCVFRDWKNQSLVSQVYQRERIHRYSGEIQVDIGFPGRVGTPLELVTGLDADQDVQTRLVSTPSCV